MALTGRRNFVYNGTRKKKTKNVLTKLAQVHCYRVLAKLELIILQVSIGKMGEVTPMHSIDLTRTGIG